MSQARALSADDVRQLRGDLAGGATPTVWFTSAAVGVPEGRSGKVITIADVEEGDYIQVRPAGSKDVLSFSAAEVTVVKPPRKRKEPAAAAAAASAATPKESTVYTPPPRVSAVEKESAAPAESEKPAVTPQRRKPRQTSVAGATIILTADTDGQWSVEVSNGKKRVLKPTTVPASAVAQAAKSLHMDVEHAVEPLLDAAREQQRVRVEQLQRELEDAQRMLDDLTS